MNIKVIIDICTPLQLLIGTYESDMHSNYNIDKPF